ncbi:MAG TPA: hypothetical protein VEA99_15985 [Gemmatimonadaceae bacterium]|nr:hypothetical protein [Gemmatimonadaceae bacterium]
MTRHSSIALLVVTLLVAPAVGRAQVTFTAAVGGAAHADRAGAVHYRTGTLPYLKAAVDGAVARAGAWRLVLGAEVAVSGHGDVTDDCPIAPNGDCRRHFPEFTAVSALAGARRTFARDLAVGVGMGVGAYSRLGYHVEVDLALPLSRQLALVAAARQLWFEVDEGRRVWMRPLTVGLRLGLR